MLTEKEVAAFLALVLAFCYATKTSARSLAKLMGITPNTAARWLRAARGQGGVERLYHINVDQINAAIQSMNAHNAKHNSYAKIVAIGDPIARVKELKALKAKAQ